MTSTPEKKEEDHVAVVRKYREEISKKFNYDAGAIIQFFIDEEKKSGRKSVSIDQKPEPKKSA